MYRYKYKLMRQIRMCKDLKHLIYYRSGHSCQPWERLYCAVWWCDGGQSPVAASGLCNGLLKSFVCLEYCLWLEVCMPPVLISCVCLAVSL